MNHTRRWGWLFQFTPGSDPLSKEPSVFPTADYLNAVFLFDTGVKPGVMDEQCSKCDCFSWHRNECFPSCVNRERESVCVLWRSRCNTRNVAVVRKAAASLFLSRETRPRDHILCLCSVLVPVSYSYSCGRMLSINKVLGWRYTQRLYGEKKKSVGVKKNTFTSTKWQLQVWRSVEHVVCEEWSSDAPN